MTAMCPTSLISHLPHTPLLSPPTTVLWVASRLTFQTRRGVESSKGERGGREITWDSRATSQLIERPLGQ